MPIVAVIVILAVVIAVVVFVMCKLKAKKEREHSMPIGVKENIIEVTKTEDSVLSEEDILQMPIVTGTKADIQSDAYRDAQMAHTKDVHACKPGCVAVTVPPAWDGTVPLRFVWDGVAVQCVVPEGICRGEKFVCDLKTNHIWHPTEVYPLNVLHHLHHLLPH